MNALFESKRYWIKFISMWTGKLTIHSFDNWKEAEWFMKQVNGELLDWRET